MLNWNQLSYTKAYLFGFSLGDSKRKCPKNFACDSLSFALDFSFVRWWTWLRNMGHLLALVAWTFLWCWYLSYYGYILHWQGRKPLFLKSNSTPMERKSLNQKHKKDLGKNHLKSKLRQLFQLSSSVKFSLTKVPMYSKSL